MTILFVAAAWVVSLCFHEFSHALVAYLGGDKSVKDKGYLTFNPLKYAHPTFSLLYPLLFLLIGGIGLPGGAVYIDRSRLRSRVWECAVSLAGPTANFLLALLLSIPFLLGVQTSEAGWFWPAYSFFVVLQVSAALMNLIPIPPLDGFGAAAAWVSREVKEDLYRHSNAGMWIVFLIFWFVEPVNAGFWRIVYAVTGALGVSPELAFQGYRAFKLW